MKEKRIDTDVRIVYDRAGFDTPHRHHVRTRLEARVCEWLLEHAVAHRHASEIFTIPTGPGKIPTLYVPDIVLHDRTPDGRSIIIEPYQVHVPKGGGTRLLAAFRARMKKRWYVIIIARTEDFRHIVKGSYDILLDARRLERLERRIPIPER